MNQGALLAYPVSSRRGMAISIAGRAKRASTCRTKALRCAGIVLLVFFSLTRDITRAIIAPWARISHCPGRHRAFAATNVRKAAMAPRRPKKQRTARHASAATVQRGNTRRQDTFNATTVQVAAFRTNRATHFATIAPRGHTPHQVRRNVWRVTTRRIKTKPVKRNAASVLWANISTCVARKVAGIRRHIALNWICTNKSITAS